MGLAFLPIEKLPLFIWGAILAGLGGFLALQEAWLSWPQLRAAGLLVVGIGVVAYDVSKRLQSSKTEDKEAS